MNHEKHVTSEKVSTSAIFLPKYLEGNINASILVISA
jgi:hypothetical protein